MCLKPPGGQGRHGRAGWGFSSSSQERAHIAVNLGREVMKVCVRDSTAAFVVVANVSFGDHTQVFMLVQQALYPWSCVPSLQE